MNRPKAVGLMVLLVAVILASASAVGCAARSDAAGGIHRDRTVVDGSPVLTVSDPDQPTRGIVVYFHGFDRDENILDLDDAHRTLTKRLVDAGYAVVAGRAGGNVFGNAASRRDYDRLVEDAVRRFGVDTVFFIAESMGAVAAINLMAGGTRLPIRGLAAINPLLNASSIPRRDLQNALHVNPDLLTVTPVALKASAMAGNSFRLYVTPDDQLLPIADNAGVFATRFGAVTNTSVVRCTGLHLDARCIQSIDIVRWFDSVGRR